MKVTAILCAFALATTVSAAEDAQTNSVGMKLVRIEAGGFVMGQGDAPPTTKEDWLGRDYDEAPAHRVTISAAFLNCAPSSVRTS